MYKRLIKLDKNPKKSFFLWGPRQSGKSTLLKAMYKKSLWIDLLKSDTFGKYVTHPATLREEVMASLQAGDHVVIDEVQKIPALMDEIHWLIENYNIVFTLCGSSARKLKRDGANLLGGRALRRELFGLVSAEVEDDITLNRFLNKGYLPSIFLSEDHWPLLAAYTGDYLKEEIAAEGLVRNIPVFSDFLSLAAMSDTEPVNFSSFARDVGVSSQTIKDYYQILEDTLIGRWLPIFKKRPKRRIQGSSKFYFFDVGVVNFLAKRKEVAEGTEIFGKALENWVAHELYAYNEYKQTYADFSFWRLSNGCEVDFIVNDMELAIEVKGTKRVNQNHTKGLIELVKDHPNVKRRIIVSLDDQKRTLESGIEIFPWKVFAKDLWAGKFF